MHALINIDHPRVADDPLRAMLRKVYRQADDDQGIAYVNSSTVTESHGGADVVWHSFQPVGKVAAHCIRHAEHRMEVLVEL